MRVRVENRVDAPEVVPQRLRPQVRRRVHEHAAARRRSSSAMDGRDRASRGSVDRHTPQSQPIIGTPCDVPVPRKRTRTDVECNIAPVKPARGPPARRPRVTRRRGPPPRGARRPRVRAPRPHHGDAAIARAAVPGTASRRRSRCGPFLLEETYEALDAIDRGDLDELGGELGDVLFQCVFQAQIAAEAGRFDIADVHAVHHRQS